MGAAERPQREGERRQQAVAERQQQLQRMHGRRDRQRNDRAEQGRDRERQNGAEHEPDHGANGRQQQHLPEIDREHPAAGSAERLQGRDDVALAIDVALHGIGNTDAADQQRGETDQGQELGEVIDIALQRRRCVGAAADLPAGVRQLRVGGGGHRAGGGIAAVRQAQAIRPAHQAAGHQQPGRPQRRLADDDAGPEGQAGGKLVRLVLDRRGDLEGGAADGDPRAGFQLKPRQQGGVDRRAKGAVALRQRVRKRQRRIERHRAVERVERIDRFDLDQRLTAVCGACHRAQGGADRNLALGGEEASLRSSGFAVDQRERQVAAEDAAALAIEPVGQAGRQRTDAGNRHDAEREAGDEDAKAAHAAAQFAEREAQWREFGARGRCGDRHAGLGAVRTSRIWTGRNSSSGMPIIMAASQAYGGIQVCAAPSFGPQT